MATESSVLVNLRDLFEIEADRRAEEAAAKERAKADAAARAEAERRAREDEIARARDDERRRAEEERARRDAELEARLKSLRDELSEVRTQREEMRVRVAEIAARPEPSARRGSWIAGVMAAASLVAAVTATAVAWPREEPRMAELAPRPVVTEPVVEQAADVAVPEPAAPIPEPLVAAADPAPRAPVHVPRRGRRQRVERTEQDSLSRQLDLGEGNEVLSDDFLEGAGR